jgi:radical SAM protein with 4Fe4S-binding SPASM domain
MAEKPTYLRIKSNYLLRGWKGSPYALVNRANGQATFMTAEAFRTAQFCNGRFKEDNPFFTGGRRLFLRKLDRLGFLERLDEPGSLLPDQEYVYYDNRYLQLAFWSLTGHCNYRCKHCYMSAPHAALPHPATEWCLDVVDQIAACGIRRVSLTGGEPLIRRDFLQIVDRILERDLQIDVIMTNGALVNERFLDELAARNCRPEIHVSFDGPKWWHDWLRGVDGAYDSVRRALALCHERGLVTGCNLVLHKGNLQTLRESVRELAELGVGSLKVDRLKCVGEGASLADYALTAGEEYEAYLDYIPRYVEDGMPVPVLKLADLFYANKGRFRVDAEWYPESADYSGKPLSPSARTMVYLGPDGRILPYIPMADQVDAIERSFPTFNETTLAEALSDASFEDFIGMTLGDFLGHNPSCASCAYRNRCGGGCRARAVVESGGSDVLGVDSEACQIFLGGYYDRVKSLIANLQPMMSKASNKEGCGC